MKVLIAVDNDEQSHDAVNFAAGFVPDDADVLVLNVAQAGLPVVAFGGPGTFAAYAGTSWIERPHVVQEQIEEGAREVVHDAAERLGIDPEHLHERVEMGAVGPTICHVAEQEGVELIVLGTHDRGSFSRWWFGSVSDHVVHNAPCPVLVVR